MRNRLLPPLTPWALQECERNAPAAEQSRYREIGVAVRAALAPLASNAELTNSVIARTSRAYLAALEPIVSGELGDIDQAMELTLQHHPLAQGVLGPASAEGIRLRRTLDTLLDHAHAANLPAFGEPVTLCAGALLAVDEGRIELSRRLIELADLSVACAVAGESGAAVAERGLDLGELEPWAPTSAVIGALRGAPALFSRRDHPFERGAPLDDQQAAAGLADFSRRATLNLMARSSNHALPSAHQLAESLRQGLELSPTVAHEYGQAVISRLRGNPEALRRLEKLRESREQAEASLFA